MNEMSTRHCDSGTVMAAPDREVTVREAFGITLVNEPVTVGVEL